MLDFCDENAFLEAYPPAAWEALDRLIKRGEREQWT